MNFNIRKTLIQLYWLTILLTFFTSCNGQVKTTTLAKIPVVAATLIQPKASQSMIQDHNDDIWYEDSIGVTVYSPSTNIFKHYTEKDGLSSNRVLSILEDNKGKIWLATANGITTYENGKFSIITIPGIPAITGSLNYYKSSSNVYPYNGNFINCILQDSKGNLWFGHQNGIYRFDGKNYSHFTENDGVENNTGYAISDGQILGPESIIEDKSGKIWFGGRGTDGLFCYDGKTLNHYNVDGIEWVRPLMQSSNGDVWFNARNKPLLYIYDGKSFKSFSTIELKDWVFNMVEDNNKNLWFNNGKNDGVTFYDGKKFINYTTEIGVLHNASNFFCTGILKDKEGNIWFKSLSTKLCKFDGKTFKFYQE
jgi:ligand-binding sensor domain-containing protein